MHLGKTGEKMALRIESRETHNDKKLAQVYEDFRKHDHSYFTAQEIQSKEVIQTKFRKNPKDNEFFNYGLKIFP